MAIDMDDFKQRANDFVNLRALGENLSVVNRLLPNDDFRAITHLLHKEHHGKHQTDGDCHHQIKNDGEKEGDLLNGQQTYL